MRMLGWAASAVSAAAGARAGMGVRCSVRSWRPWKPEQRASGPSEQLLPSQRLLRPQSAAHSQPTLYDFLRVEHLALQLHQGSNQGHHFTHSLLVSRNSSRVAAAQQLWEQQQQAARDRQRALDRGVSRCFQPCGSGTGLRLTGGGSWNCTLTRLPSWRSSARSTPRISTSSPSSAAGAGAGTKMNVWLQAVELLLSNDA